MALLSVIAIFIFWNVYSLYMQQNKSNKPIKDFKRFSKETIGMSKKEILKGLKEGRW